ncbi:MAG: gliding motility-associated C-terminal domain-containing protein [Bacteroidota bacterium]
MKTKIKNIVFLLGFLLLWQTELFSQGATCATADPFCSDTTVSFQAGVNTGNYGNYIGCLSNTPNPAWYYFQVLQPGRINVHLWTTPSRDLDFICWGPFNAGNIQELFEQNICDQLQNNCGGCQSHDPVQGANPVSLGGYPIGNIIDCSYSSASEEYVHIPNAQAGQWYMFLITNFSNQQCDINFQRDVSSTGNSNCNIMIPAEAYGDIVCEGESANLTSASTSPQFTYTWTGPNGFYQSGPNPNVYFPSASLLNAGTYSLTYSTPDSTSAPAYCNLVVHSLPVISHPNDTIYFGQTDTILMPSAYTYVWSTGFSGNPLLITPNQTGQYQVTATSVYGCTSTLTFNIKVLNAPIVVRNPDVNHICQGLSVSANVTFRMLTLACTNVIQYRYIASGTWSNWLPYIANNPIQTDTLLGIEMRAYQLTCNDAGNLFNSDTTSVFWIIHPQITRASYIRTPEESGICLGASLMLTVDTTAGIPIVMEYQYQPPTQPGWSSGNTFTPIDPGMAWIRGRVASGQNGCLTTEWDWFAWLVQPQPQIQGLASQQLCLNNSVDLVANVIDGYGTTFYKWEKSTINCNGIWDSIPGADSTIYNTPILNLTEYYRLQVTQSGFNCQATSDCIILQVNPIPTITISHDTTVCLNAPLAISAIVQSGTGANHYQYQFRYSSTEPWTNTGIDDDTLNIPSITQNMELRCLLSQTGLGCEDTSNIISIIVNTPPLIITQPSNINDCIAAPADFTVVASSIPAPTYQWFGPSGLILNAITASLHFNSILYADTGYYKCVITNSCGSITSDSVHLNIVPTYVAPTEILGPIMRCAGLGWDLYTVDAQNPSSSIWSITPAGAGIVNPSTGEVAWNATWNGTAIITNNSSGCGILSVLSVEVVSLLPVVNPTAIIGDTARCQGWGFLQYSTVALNDTGFVWSIINAGTSVINPATGLVSWDQQFAGNATISVFARGCQGPTTTISLNVHVLNAPVLYISQSLDRCEGENATFMVNHLDTNTVIGYQWFGPSGIINGATDTILNISPILLADSGTYYCQIIAICGNAQSPPAELTVHHRPIPAFTAAPNCMRDTIFFANTSTADDMPIISQWYFGDGDSSALFSPSHIYADSGSYTVVLIVENAFGCSDSISSTIQSFSVPFFTLTTTNDSCFADSNGTITVNVNYGLMPYSYTLNSFAPQDYNYFDSIPAGLNFITVMDANNCIVRDTISIFQPSLLESNYINSDVKCFSDSTGIISVNVKGGTFPYSFIWSNGDTNSLVHVPIGNYSVLITDAMGCTNTHDAVLISQPNPLVIDSIMKPITCSLLNDAMLAVYPEGGYGFSTILWSNNSTNDTIQNLSAGTYTATITDENGCTHVSNFVVDPNPEICWEIWTSFSPNGDGQNDVWNIRWASLYPNMVVQVFNRWGNKVFENKGEFNGWDGTGASGKLLPPETYYFVININEGSTPIQTGTVTIFY